MPILRSWVGFKAGAKPHSLPVFIQKQRCHLPPALPPSLPAASGLHIINTALSPPKRLGLPSSASPMLPGTPLPARARAPQPHRGFTPSSTLIFNQRWLRGALGLPWGHFCLSLGCQLCVYLLLSGLG